MRLRRLWKLVLNAEVDLDLLKSYLYGFMLRNMNQSLVLYKKIRRFFLESLCWLALLASMFDSVELHSSRMEIMALG